MVDCPLRTCFVAGSTAVNFNTALAALTEQYGSGEENAKESGSSKSRVRCSLSVCQMICQQAPRIVRSNVRRKKDVTRYSARDMRAILGNSAAIELRDGSADSNFKRRRVESGSEVVAASTGKKKRAEKANVVDEEASHPTQEYRQKKKKKKNAARTPDSRERVPQKSKVK